MTNVSNQFHRNSVQRARSHLFSLWINGALVAAASTSLIFHWLHGKEISRDVCWLFFSLILGFDVWRRAKKDFQKLEFLAEEV